MRTTINIEEEKLSRLLQATHQKNKSKAVRLAVEEYLRKERLRKIELLRGGLSFNKKILAGRHHGR
ncbi:hypothetical protein EPN16_01730 [bacterium]|nr:MAG: hypothetical protein EPN16_01730 [bacterium]